MGRRTNLALAVLLGAAVATGLIAQGMGVDLPLDPAPVHGVVALAILALAPWKSLIVRRGLARARPGRSYSLMLLIVVLVVIATGLLHSYGAVTTLGPLTVMQVHVGGAVVAILLAVDHYRRHPVRPRRADLDRRAFLRSAATALAAAVAWLGWEGTLQALSAPGERRRFTGSHQRGSGDPSAYPVTSWLDDRIQVIDPEAWRLLVAGRTHRLGDLEAMPQETFPAVIDCTGGWYSEQEWAGIRLDRLLDPGEGRSFVVWSATGYARRYPRRDLSSTWLALRCGGEPLTPGHGFPARIVAPGRRGFWWVKWVTRIEASGLPWWVQSPFPLT